MPNEELRQIIAWLPAGAIMDACVSFNNIPRVKNAELFRELMASDHSGA